MKNLRLLLKFMKGNMLLLVGAVIAVNLSTALATVIPLVIRVSIDSVIGGEPFELPQPLINLIENAGGKAVLAQNLWLALVLLVLLTLGQGLFTYYKGKLSAVASQNSAKKIRDHIYDHLQHLPYDYHVKSQAGDLIQRCTSDVETVQSFVSGQLIELGQVVVSVIFALIVMLSINVKYTVVSLALVPIIAFFTFRFFVNMKNLFQATDEAEGLMSASLQENLTGVRVVRAFGAQNFEIEKFDQKNQEYRDKLYKIVKLMSSFWSTSDFLCILQYSIVLFTGVYWAANDVISIGTLIAFSIYAGMLIWPIRHTGQMLAFMGQAFVSLGRIQEILDTKAEFTDEEGLKPEIKGQIEFKNVCFEYEEGKPILNDVSFSIKKGETIAILGATGSGKSSLVHLLIRLYEYQSGSIKIDGIELKEIDKKWLRKYVGIVLQESFLFSKTIKENIRLGRPDAHEQDIYESASISAIHHTIEGFEKGYETLLGERGVTLSGGQRQRLSIARTILSNAPVLIFDDSLSAVDIETDSMIRKALKRKSKKATTIIISHRITTLAEADTIYVLDKGKIRQSGTHEELINQEGLYKRIWQIQNSLEDELSNVI